MPTFEEAPTSPAGEPSHRSTGAVYGTPAAPQPPQDRFLRIALAVGGFGLLLGVLFATGVLTGGDGSPEAPPPAAAQTAAGVAAGSGAPATSPTPTTSPTPSASPTPTASPTPSPPPATLGPTQVRVFRSVVSSLCLDVTPDEDPEGADLRQVPCTATATQRWQPTPVTADIVALVNVASGKCLDVDNFGTDEGVPVQQWSCNGGANQQWRIATAGGVIALVNAHSGKCLALPDPGAGVGTKVVQLTCDGAAGRLWLEDPVT